MRISIEHSGGVNGEAAFTVKLIDIEHSTLSVAQGLASVRFESCESELRDLVARARHAIADGKLRDKFRLGLLTLKQYERARLALDRKDFADHA